MSNLSGASFENAKMGSTNFGYNDLSAAKNEMPKKWNPDGADWIDPGLGGFMKNAGYALEVYEPQLGKHKVPTLRNVDKRPDNVFVKAYGHNGFFKSLEEIVHFYNTRDIANWPPPEVADNVNTDELGDLELTAEEESALHSTPPSSSDTSALPPNCSAGGPPSSLDGHYNPHKPS